MKWLLLLLLAIPAYGQTCTATSCAESAVQTALTACSSGGTVVIPACSSTTWTSQISFAPTGNVKIQGAGTYSGTGDPNGGTSGVITYTDNTNINLTTVDQAFSITCSSSAFVTITGLSLTTGYSSSHGNITLASASPHQVCFRFYGNHVLNSVSGNVMVDTVEGYGVIDHNLVTDTATSGGEFLRIVGDFASSGYTDWAAPTVLGSNQAVYVEANDMTWTDCNPDTDVFDGYWGPKIVIRFNTIYNQAFGDAHGTETNPGRGVVVTEIYGNADDYFTGSGCSTAGEQLGYRGGTGVTWGNTFTGTSGGGSWPITAYRYEFVNPVNPPFGEGLPGTLNWTPTGTNSTTNTANASDWAATTLYAANAVIGPTSNNSGHYNYQNQSGISCTSGATRPATFNQTMLGTTSDGTCSWVTVGGSTTAGPGGDGFCAANPDTQCTTNSTCNALSSGDTCTRYFDAASTSGACSLRDEPGCGHNQVSMPIYEWKNTGSALPSTTFAVASPMNAIIVQNRDYYRYVSSGFTGASGVGAGTLASAPSTCTQGVGYFATDQGNWNLSGNGVGQGELYVCSGSNQWVEDYEPYTYPDPLEGIVAVQAVSGQLWAMLNHPADAAKSLFSGTHIYGTVKIQK